MSTLLIIMWYRISTADNVMSVQVGLEFRRAGGKTLKELAARRSEFEPYYFASWNVGGNMPIHRVKLDDGSGLGVLIGVSGDGSSSLVPVHG